MADVICTCGHPYHRHAEVDAHLGIALYCVIPGCECEEYAPAALADGQFAPDLIGELVGWRAWKVVGTPEKPRLYSNYGHADKKSMLWPPDKWFEAICPKTAGHVAGSMDEKLAVPVESCSCGIYAAISRDRLIELNYNSYTDEQLIVIGKVGFIGKVIPGSQGYRAEKARVIELFVPYENWKYVKPLEEAYHVPVHLANTWLGEEDLAEQAATG